MHVKLVGAGPLPESCDCFATIQVCPQGGRSKEGVEGIIFKTKTQRATNTPLFNENFVLKPVTSLEAELVVSLVNKKAIGADQTICDVKIPLGKVTPGANVDVQDLQLSGKDTGRTIQTLSFRDLCSLNSVQWASFRQRNGFHVM